MPSVGLTIGQSAESEGQTVSDKPTASPNRKTSHCRRRTIGVAIGLGLLACIAAILNQGIPLLGIPSADRWLLGNAGLNPNGRNTHVAQSPTPVLVPSTSVKVTIPVGYVYYRSSDIAPNNPDSLRIPIDQPSMVATPLRGLGFVFIASADAIAAAKPTELTNLIDTAELEREASGASDGIAVHTTAGSHGQRIVLGIRKPERIVVCAQTCLSETEVRSMLGSASPSN